jgi:hypothetical protein
VNLDQRIPEEIDPTNELERQLAIVYCRLNTWRHPLTGADMSQEERDWYRANNNIAALKVLARPGVTQRLWMAGRQFWTNEPSALPHGRETWLNSPAYLIPIRCRALSAEGSICKPTQPG